MSFSVVRRVTAGVLSAGLLLSSTTASAANVSSASEISPWAALSAFGTQASSAALCAGTAATVSAAATTQAAPAKPGCVLPVVDQPPPAVDPAPYPPVVESSGIGVSPLLLGLGALALAGLIYLIASDDPQDDDASPVTPA